MTWSIDLARKTYSIPHWSDGYFDVDGKGHIVVKPTGAADPAVSGAGAHGPPPGRLMSRRHPPSMGPSSGMGPSSLTGSTVGL